MVAKPGSLAPHSLTRWTRSGVKLFGGLLDFPGRPGVSYFLAWLGMYNWYIGPKSRIPFRQVPGWWPHSRFACSSSARTRLRRWTHGEANPLVDSCGGWIKCHRKLLGSRISSCYLIMGPHVDGCVMLGYKNSVFLLKGWGGDGVEFVGSWAEVFTLYFASIVPICMYRDVIGCE